MVFVLVASTIKWIKTSIHFEHGMFNKQVQVDNDYDMDMIMLN